MRQGSVPDVASCAEPQWVAQAVADVAREEPPPRAGAWTRQLHDAGVPSLAALQTRLQQLATELALERSDMAAQISAQMHRARDVVPAAARDAQQMGEDAAQLRHELARAQRAVAPAAGAAPGDGTVGSRDARARVYELATIKRRMHAARDVLMAAESWSMVEADVEGFLAERRYERAAERITETRASLARFDEASEYVAARRKLLARLLDALEAGVSSVLVDAVRAGDVPGVARCARVFADVGRSQEFTQWYFGTRRERVLHAWRDSSPDAPLVRLAALYEALVALAREEHAHYAPALFAERHAAVDALLASALRALDPSVAEAVHAGAARTEAEAPALPALVDAYSATVRAAQALEEMCSAAPDAAAEPAAPIHLAPTTPTDGAAPLVDAFLPYQLRYTTLETQLLTHQWRHDVDASFSKQLYRIFVRSAAAHASVWVTRVQDVAALLHEYVPVFVRACDAAEARMLAFTRGTGIAALLHAVHTTLSPAVCARFEAAVETLRMRFRHRPDGAQRRTDADDPVEDWGVVHASVRVLDAALHLERALCGWYPALVERARAPLAAALAPRGNTRVAHGSAAALLAASPHAEPLRRFARGAVPAVLPAPERPEPAVLAAPTYAAQQLVLDFLLSGLRREVDAYRAQGAAPAPAPARAGLEAEVRIPSFSRSPSEGVVRIGEGLLNLPRMLEPFVEKELRVFAHAAEALPHVAEGAEAASPGGAASPLPAESTAHRHSRTAHRSVSASLLPPPAATQAPAVSSEADGEARDASAGSVLSLWLRSLTLTLLAAVRTEVLPALAGRAAERKQLATDVEYLCNIASALNAHSAALRQWAELLAMEPAQVAALPDESALRRSEAFRALYT